MFRMIDDTYGMEIVVKNEREFRSIVKKCGFEVPELVGQYQENDEGHQVWCLCDPESGNSVLEEFHKAPYNCNYAIMDRFSKKIYNRTRKVTKVKCLYKEYVEVCRDNMMQNNVIIGTWEQYQGEYVYEDEAMELEDEALSQ